jgi:hypothetical protein
MQPAKKDEIMIAPGISAIAPKTMAVAISPSINGHSTDVNPVAIAGK